MSQLYTLPLDQLPDPLPIEPLRKPFDVTITPPGSKSITCRAYVLAALAEGESKIIRPLRADDPDHLLNALCTLGAEARWVKSDMHDGEDVYIKGVGGRFPRGGNLYMGDGGAPTRFMIAAACLAAEPVTIDASPRMRERPIAEGVDMLRQLGAKIDYVEAEGRLPVRVAPVNPWHLGGVLNITKTASSQFVSAVLLISFAFGRGLQMDLMLPTSPSYIVLSLDSLAHFRIRARRNLGSYFSQRRLKRIVISHQYLKGKAEAFVEADASSALYWGLATLAVPKSVYLVEALPVWSRQPDRFAIFALDQFGAEIAPYEQSVIGSDGIGVDTQRLRKRNSANVNCNGHPDGSIALAIASTLARTNTRLTGLRTLRVKETDRIAALANELRKVGCTVNTGEDWIEITPPTRTSGAQPHAGSDRREDPDRSALQSQSGSSSLASARSSDPAFPATNNPIIIETYNDHRMAMSFAILGLNPPNGQRLAIRNPACVKKSYPTFWKDFAKLYQ